MVSTNLYTYSADITKMFRQILISPADCHKMKIIWRADKAEPLHEYELVTVTYGTDAAPWQAIRVLRQCAIDNSPDKRKMDIIMKSF